MDNLNVIIKSKPCTESGILKVTKDGLDSHIRGTLKHVNEDNCNSSEKKGITLKGISQKYDPKKEKGIVRFCLLTHGEGGILKVGKTVFGHKLHGKEPLRIIEESNQDSCKYNLDKNDSSIKKEILVKSRQVSSSNIFVLENTNTLVDKKRKLIKSNDFLNLNLGYICLKNTDSSLGDKINDNPKTQIINESNRKDFKIVNIDVKKIQECKISETPVNNFSHINPNQDVKIKSADNVFVDHSYVYFDDTSGREEVVDGTSGGCKEIIDETVDMCLMPHIAISDESTQAKKEQTQLFRKVSSESFLEYVNKEGFEESSSNEDSIDRHSCVDMVDENLGKSNVLSQYCSSHTWRDSLLYEHSYSLVPPRPAQNCSPLNIENSDKINCIESELEYCDKKSCGDKSVTNNSPMSPDVNPHETIIECSPSFINNISIVNEDLKSDSDVNSQGNENVILDTASNSFSRLRNNNGKNPSLEHKYSCSGFKSDEECDISNNNEELSNNSLPSQEKFIDNHNSDVQNSCSIASTVDVSLEDKTDKLPEGHLLNLNLPGLIIKPLNNRSETVIEDISIERLENPMKDGLVENEVPNKISVSDRIESGDIIIEKITNLNKGIISYSQRDKHYSTSGSCIGSSIDSYCNQVLLENNDLIIEKACTSSLVRLAEDRPTVSHSVDQLPCTYNTTISVIDKSLDNCDDYNCSYSQKYDGYNSVYNRKESDLDMVYQLSAKMLTEEALRKQNEIAYQYYDPTYWRIYDDLRNILGPDIVDVYNNFIHFMVPESFAMSVQWMDFSKSVENNDQPSSVTDVSEGNQSVLPTGPPQSEQPPYQVIPSSYGPGYPPPYCQPGYSPSISPQPYDPTGQLTITPLDRDGKPAQGSQPLILPQNQQLTITPLVNPQYQPYSQCTKMGTQPLRRRGRPPLDPDYDTFATKKYIYSNYYLPYGPTYPSDLQPPYFNNRYSYGNYYNQNYGAPYLYRSHPPEMSFLNPQLLTSVKNYDMPPDYPPSPPSLIPLAKGPVAQSSLASDVSLSPIPNSVAHKFRNTFPPENLLISSTVASLTPLNASPSESSPDNILNENVIIRKPEVDNSSNIQRDSNNISQTEVNSESDVEVESLFIDESSQQGHDDQCDESKGTNICTKLDLDSFVSGQNEIGIVNISNEPKDTVQDNQDMENSPCTRENCSSDSFPKLKNIEPTHLTNVGVLHNKNNMKRIKRKKKLLTLKSKKKMLSISRSSTNKKMFNSSICKSNKPKNKFMSYQNLNPKLTHSDILEVESIVDQSKDCNGTLIEPNSELENRFENILLKDDTQEDTRIDSSEACNDSGVRRSGRKRKVIEGNPKFRDMERVDLSKDFRFLEKLPIKKKKLELKVKPLNKVLNKRVLEERMNEQQAKEIKLKEELKRKEEERRRKEEIEKKRTEDRQRKQILMLKQFHEMNDIYLKPQTFF